MPISADPALLITALTSAKSKFIKPCTVIKSDIPCTPWRNTSSATLKASNKGVFLSMVCNSLSLGTVISVSTLSRSCEIAYSALRRRFSPSKANGLVAKPTTKAPCSLAIFATTWPAPLPVPPPAPIVTKTMSAPSNTFLISSLDTLAACSPT